MTLMLTIESSLAYVNYEQALKNEILFLRRVSLILSFKEMESDKMLSCKYRFVDRALLGAYFIFFFHHKYQANCSVSL